MNPSSSDGQAPPRILLLGNDPGDAQWSLLDYADQLHRRLVSQAGDRMRVELRFPDSRRLFPLLRRSGAGRGAATYLSRYLLYPKILRKERFALAHLIDHGNAWLTRFLEPSKTVVTCHDLIPLVLENPGRSVAPWFSKRAFGQAMEGIRRAARVIANSRCTRKDLVSRLEIPEERITVIPLGVDPGFRPPSSPQEVAEIRGALGLPAERLLLHTGQNAFYKNIETLLETLGVLARRRESLRLVRAGPLLSARQRALAKKLGVEGLLLELGPLQKSQLFQLYRAVDLLVYPSWYEGLGLPPLEAMASGVPVIVSDRGALPETVGGAAQVVRPDAPEELADAVQLLLQDPSLRDSLRTQGLQRAGRFRWETTADQTLAVYRSLLDGIL